MNLSTTFETYRGRTGRVPGPVPDQRGEKYTQPRQGEGEEQKNQRKVERDRRVAAGRYLYQAKRHAEPYQPEYDEDQGRESFEYVELHTPILLFAPSPKGGSFSAGNG